MQLQSGLLTKIAFISSFLILAAGQVSFAGQPKACSKNNNPKCIAAIDASMEYGKTTYGPEAKKREIKCMQIVTTAQQKNVKKEELQKMWLACLAAESKDFANSEVGKKMESLSDEVQKYCDCEELKEVK